MKRGLIENWDTKCLNKISNKKIELRGKFKEYVLNFDFSIFDIIEPEELIDQYQQTIYFSFRFGGGLRKKPKRLKKPSVIKDSEQLYVKKLYEAYSQHKNEEITDITNLKKYKYLFQHFQRQRTYFYQAESLRVFERDTLPNHLNAFESLKDQVYHGIIDTLYDEYKDGFERVKVTTEKAKTLLFNPENILNDYVTVQDRMGLCHHLANETRENSDEPEVAWVINYE